MASRCSWFLVRAHSISVSVSSRSAWVRIGEATSITSSQASTRRILGGAIGTGPRRIARSAREDCSMVVTSRTKSVVDEVDLIVGILIGADQEKIGEVPQHHRLALVATLRDRAFELLDEFKRSAHAPRKTVLVGHGLGARVANVHSHCRPCRFSNS